MRTAFGLLALLGLGCGGARGGGPADAAGDAAGSAGVGSGVAGATGGGGGASGADAAAPDAAGRDWSRVEALLREAATGAGAAASFGLVVWDSADRRVFEHMEGGFSPDTRVSVASASKLVSGLVLFDAIRRDELGLDSTTGQVLGWTGPSAAITLRHLLSFTSGLPRAAPCTASPLSTLAKCVDTLRDATPVAAPGALFDYGSTHLHVAARMAEVASGKTWSQLFADTLRVPLGLAADVAYYTFPKQQTGLLNPLVAGGLRASMNEYRPVLALAFHRGSGPGGLTVGKPELFDLQAKEPYPAATVGVSPIVQIGLTYRYGLTAWLMCDTPAAGCAELSSPGAFGFTPWLDRATGYYAILGMELDRDAADNGVVDFAVKLQQQLAPLIRERL